MYNVGLNVSILYLSAKFLYSKESNGRPLSENISDGHPKLEEMFFKLLITTVVVLPLILFDT